MTTWATEGTASAAWNTESGLLSQLGLETSAIIVSMASSPLSFISMKKNEQNVEISIRN